MREGNTIAAGAGEAAEAQAAVMERAEVAHRRAMAAAGLRRRAADALAAGVAIMCAALAPRALRASEYAHAVAAACGRAADFSSEFSAPANTLTWLWRAAGGGGLGDAVRFAVCCGGVALRRAGGLALAVAAACQLLRWVASQAPALSPSSHPSPSLSHYHSLHAALPFTTLLLGLGVGGGLLGRTAIAAFGGAPAVWFALWLVLCGAHAGISLGAGTATMQMWAQGRGGAHEAAMLAALAVALPAALATLPFAV